MRRVLVIDDNPDLRQLIGMILEGAGYAVELAADGEAGLRSQCARPFDYPALKLLAISGGGAHAKGVDYLFTAREIGAHAVLPKPFEQEALLEAVRSLH